MDWVSTVISLLGLGQRHIDRIADRRAEAFRLTVEVSGDVGRALELINIETERLVARCARICPGEPAAVDACVQAMTKIRSVAQKLQALTDTVKKRLVAIKGTADWERLIRDLNEWRATASRLVPWIEGIVGRFDAVLDNYVSGDAR